MYIYRSSFVANVPNALFTEEKKKKKDLMEAHFSHPLIYYTDGKGVWRKEKQRGYTICICPYKTIL